ncbi:MAG: hypothetical protein ACYCZ0_04560 [Minisyncoccota bacterium]
MSVLHFLSYHNAVPIAVSVVLLGAGASFAATNPETIYSESQTVLSIDNTYLVNKDLGSYSPRAQIVAVTEDVDTYYIEYVLYTIDLDDAVWKDVTRRQVMKVSKEALGPYRDLGVYVTGQLKENIEQEIRRLAETQEIEKRNISQKIVATEYGGLIGKMLDTTTETLPGYTPVVVPPPEPQVAASGEAAGGAQASGSQSQETPSTPAPQSDPGAPTIQVLGNNPARIPLGSAYADLGAVITGPTPLDQALGIHVFVNGVETQTPTIDTATVGETIIRYEATNAAGQRGVAERVVVVYNPNAPATTAASTTPVTEQTDAAAPSAESSPATEIVPAPSASSTDATVQ